MAAVEDDAFRSRHNAPRRTGRRTRMGDHKAHHIDEYAPVVPTSWYSAYEGDHSATAAIPRPSYRETVQTAAAATRPRRPTVGLGFRRTVPDGPRSASQYATSPAAVRERITRLSPKKNTGTGVFFHSQDANPMARTTDYPGFKPDPVVHHYKPDSLNIFTGLQQEAAVSTMNRDIRGVMPTTETAVMPVRKQEVGAEWIFGRDRNGRTEQKTVQATALSAEVAGWRTLDTPPPQPRAEAEPWPLTSAQAVYGRGSDSTRIGNRAVTCSVRHDGGQIYPEKQLHIMSDDRVGRLPRRRQQSIVLSD